MDKPMPLPIAARGTGVITLREAGHSNPASIRKGIIPLTPALSRGGEREN
jgi:hypothetical protein